MKYQYMTKYNRGFDLVWSYVAQLPSGTFQYGDLTATVSTGYEGARRSDVSVEYTTIGNFRNLREEYKELWPVYQDFMIKLERAAIAHSLIQEVKEEKRQSEQECKRKSLIERVLSNFGKRNDK